MSDRTLRPYLMVARIRRAHGLKGEVAVEILTDRPDGLASVTDCYLLPSPEPRAADAVRPVRIVDRRGHEGALLRLEGIEDRTAAEAIRGYYLAVDRDQAYALPEDGWFVADLIGCHVYDATRGELGVLHAVEPGPANDYFVIRRRDHRQDLLLPALKSVIDRVDLAEGRIDVTLPDGLWEIYADGADAPEKG